MPTTVNDREMRGSDFRVGISKQTLKGVINTNPVFVPVRRTEGINVTEVTYTEDPSVNNLFQGKEQIKDGETFSAEIQAVTTKQSIDFLIQSLHADNVSFDVAGSDIAFTATGITSVADDFGNYFVGQGIWVVGSTGALNDRFYVIKEVTDDNTLVTEPAPAAVQSAGPSITITSKVSKNRDLPTYNTMQTRATDLSQSDDINYNTHYDGPINELSMEVPERGLWNCTASLIFEAEYESNPAAISGQTYAAPPSDKALTSAKNANPGIKAFYMDNITQTCKIKSLNFTINNNYQEDPFASCPSGYYRGDFQASGSFIVRSLISNPFVWRDKSRNSTRFTFAFLFTHGTGVESYVVFHQNVATGAEMPNGSNTVSHTEVAFSSEEKLDIATTVTVCTNWTP